MEVVNENSALLSNYEVYCLLKDVQAGQSGQRKPGKHHKSLATISYSVLKYLDNTVCKEQNPQTIANFMKALESFGLTKAEKLQLLNNRPLTAVEIQLIVEESEERLTEDQIEQLLKLIREHLPGEDGLISGDVEEEPMQEEHQNPDGS